MPLTNIFTGKELDDWSGKKTVKTGKQARSVVTAASSIGSDNALPSTPATRLLPSRSASSKESVDSSKNDSSVEASSDDNSTTVINEGRFMEHVVDSASEEGDSVDVDNVSLEGYGGGCMDCNDVVIDDDPEYIDSELIDSEAFAYWKRVRVNRSTSGNKRNPIPLKFSNETPNENMQIEVVHNERETPKPSPVTGSDQETRKSRAFLRMVRSIKNPRPSRNGTRATTPLEAINSSDDSVESEGQFTLKGRLPKSIGLTSSSKLLSKDSQDVTMDKSCASSTEDRWGGRDKYKTMDETESSVSEDQEGEEQRLKAKSLAAVEDFEEDAEIERKIVDILPPCCPSGKELEPVSSDGKVHKRHSIWHASINSGVTAARAMRSRASLLRIAKNMKFNSEAFSDGSKGSKSNQGKTSKFIGPTQKLERFTIGRASRKVWLSHLGKGIKHGTSTLRKMGNRKSPSEPNLVVCIDGKGDRLSSAQRSRRTPESSDTTKQSETDPVIEQVGQSDDPEASSVAECGELSPDYVVEIDGAVALEMCLMAGNASLAPECPVDTFHFQPEKNTFCSSKRRAVDEDGAGKNGGFLATEEKSQGKTSAIGIEKCIHSVDDLTQFGVEASFKGGISDPVHPRTLERSSLASFSESVVSGVGSESSASDFNTLSAESGEDESIVYELFPANSFSSLTGIKCYGTCTKMKDTQSTADLSSTAGFARGRWIRSNVRIRSGDVGFNDEKADLGNQDSGEADSIIECIAEEAGRTPHDGERK